MTQTSLARIGGLLSLPCTLAFPNLSHADFLADSSATLQLRNFYNNRELRSHLTAQDKRDEWAQGFMLNLKSGYTEGLVGFGMDLYGALGIKLDSSDARAGTGLLPNAFGNAGPNQYSDVSGVLKAKISKTELKVGGFMPKSPVAQSSDARLLPPIFNGATLTSTDIANLSLDMGQFRYANFRNSSGNHDKIIAANYGVTGDRFDYFGAKYAITPKVSLSYWRAELQDVYQQNYLGLLASRDVGSWVLGAEVGYFDSSEAGSAKAGDIDNRLASALLSAKYGAHTFRAGYEQNFGDSPLPYLQDTDPYAANTVQVLEFTRAREKSWQARYDFDFARLGLPGLTFLARYLKGDGYWVNGRDGKEWERDLDLSYVLQSGPLRNLSLRLRSALVRSDASIGDLDDTRFIVAYTFLLK